MLFTKKKPKNEDLKAVIKKYPELNDETTEADTKSEASEPKMPDICKKHTADWVVVGTDPDDFWREIEELDRETVVVPIDTKSLGFAAIVMGDADIEELGYITPLLYKKGNNFDPLVVRVNGEEFKIDSTADSICKLCQATPLSVLWLRQGCNSSGQRERSMILKLPAEKLRERFGKSLTRELLSDSRIMVYLHANSDSAKASTATLPIAVSPLAINTLLRRAGLGGDAMCSPSLMRTVSIFLSFCRSKNRQVQLVLRKADSSPSAPIRTVVAVHSDSYAYVEQMVLKELYDEMAKALGPGKGYRWGVSQSLSYIYVTFPELAKEIAATYSLPDELVPGVCIRTSDTGDCSLTIDGIWMGKNNRRFGGEGLSRTHRGNFDKTQFIADAKEKIFDKYTELPFRLCEQLSVDIPDAKAAIKFAFKGVGMTAAIGKKNSKILEDYLISEIDRKRKYTAYDISMMIAELPERMSEAGYSLNLVAACEKIATKAAYLDYNKLAVALPALTA